MVDRDKDQEIAIRPCKKIFQIFGRYLGVAMRIDKEKVVATSGRIPALYVMICIGAGNGNEIIAIQMAG